MYVFICKLIFSFCTLQKKNFINYLVLRHFILHFKKVPFGVTDIKSHHRLLKSVPIRIFVCANQNYNNDKSHNNKIFYFSIYIHTYNHTIPICIFVLVIYIYISIF